MHPPTPHPHQQPSTSSPPQNPNISTNVYATGRDAYDQYLSDDEDGMLLATKGVWERGVGDYKAALGAKWAHAVNVRL